MTSNGPKLDWDARVVIGGFLVGGLAVVGVMATRAESLTRLTTWQEATLGLVSALLLASLYWPLVLYRGAHSEAFHHDEAFFVILALLVPPVATVAAFTAMTVLSQVLKHRPFAKSVFNFGQVTVSVGLGLVVSRALAPPTTRVTPTELLAALAGGVVYFVFNSGAVASVLVVMGTPWRTCLLDGLRTRLVQAGAALLAGLLLALTISSYRWSLVLLVPVLIGLRLLLAGHFKARHDRARLQGLFDVTLEANNRLHLDGLFDEVLDSARVLLRCNDAWIGREAPGPGEMGTVISLAGDELWLVVSGRPRQEPFDQDDRTLLDALGAVGTGARTNAELFNQVHYERERLTAITRSIGEGVCAMDQDGLLTFVNPAAADMLGLQATVVSDDRPARGSGVLAPEFLLRPARLAMLTGEVVRDEDADFLGATGTLLPVAYTVSAMLEGSRAVGAVLAFRDITERKAFEDEMVHHAFYDTLTGLANRRLLLEHLNRALAGAERSHKTHAVLFIDVDRFKAINDSLGHTAGDELLVVLGQRMQTTVGHKDLLARFGGDEFVLLLEDVGDEADAIAAAERIHGVVERPVMADGHDIVVSVSIGIAFTEVAKSGEDVLRNADVAMYQAKAKGRGGSHQLFDTVAMGGRSAERLDLETALRKGLERRELEVYYQPFFAIDTKRIVGAEALVRWHHPDRGLLAPGHFIEMAEETGLILPLGRFVLEEACGWARAVRDSLAVDLLMNINLSPRQFAQPGLVEEVDQALRAAGIKPERIMLEITETMVMADVDSARVVMDKLRSLGVKLAMDDFGTGHSSLGYLKQFPLDEVKVDRSFVSGLGIDLVDSAIVKAVIDLARALDMTAVAEGVETAGQLRALSDMGCPIAQGYYFSRPLPVNEFTELLERSLITGDLIPEVIQLA
jgi:diguanylate cyclase (GGDEF)-like protein/PAS domain S-box-containing protein